MNLFLASALITLNNAAPRRDFPQPIELLPDMDKLAFQLFD